MCSIDGVPQPNITWFKNDKLFVTTGEQNNMFLSPNGRYLQVNSAQFDSLGEYLCVAENHLGSSQRRFIVEFAAEWSEWSNWSNCSKTCMNPRQYRKRKCLIHNSQRNIDRDRCVGTDTEIRPCVNTNCKPKHKTINHTTRENSTIIVRIENEMEIDADVRSITINLEPNNNWPFQ